MTFLWILEINEKSYKISKVCLQYFIQLIKEYPSRTLIILVATSSFPHQFVVGWNPDNVCFHLISSSNPSFKFFLHCWNNIIMISTNNYAILIIISFICLPHHFCLKKRDWMIFLENPKKILFFCQITCVELGRKNFPKIDFPPSICIY